MLLKDAYKDANRPVFSFEFFLPKTPEGFEKFKETVHDLKTLHPSFLTLTYGAMGTSREKTLETSGWMKKASGVETVAHLTCIAHSRPEIERIVETLRSYGIENIMALRGDPPLDGSALPLEKRDYKYAVDLVRHLKRLGNFSIGVAGYPEGHLEAASKEADLRHLHAKVQAGADAVFTQLFFNNADYFLFAAEARKSGIEVPIVPGIMPIRSFKQIQKFTSMCGAKLPRELVALLEPIRDDDEAVAQAGIGYALRQCRELLAGGAPGIHFYTLNQSRASLAVCSELQRELSR